MGGGVWEIANRAGMTYRVACYGDLKGLHISGRQDQALWAGTAEGRTALRVAATLNMVDEVR